MWKYITLLLYLDNFDTDCTYLLLSLIESTLMAWAGQKKKVHAIKTKRQCAYLYRLLLHKIGLVVLVLFLHTRKTQKEDSVLFLIKVALSVVCLHFRESKTP